MKKKLKKLLISIKNNKLLTLLIVLIILVIILCIVAVKVLIFPSYKTDKYGDRLDNIESVKLDDSRFNDIKNNFEAVSGFEINNIKLTGKIVNIFISVDSEITVDSIKENADKFIKCFSESEIAYYDFQVFVTGEGDKYPMLGYKHKNSEGLFWNYEGGSSEE